MRAGGRHTAFSAAGPTGPSLKGIRAKPLCVQHRAGPRALELDADVSWSSGFPSYAGCTLKQSFNSISKGKETPAM